MRIADRWLTVLFGAALLAVPPGAAQAGQKCNPGKPETTPTGRFKVDGKEGTVFDIMTGLTWKICAEGMPYSNGRCTGNMNFTWAYANKTFSDHANGWRLPNIDELRSIVEKRCAEPAINLQVFPDTQPSSFWSATAGAGNSDYAYNVFYGRGLLGNDLKTNSYYVRLVRGKQWSGFQKEGKK